MLPNKLSRLTKFLFSPKKFSGVLRVTLVELVVEVVMELVGDSN